MKYRPLILLALALACLCSCQQKPENQDSSYVYFDKPITDTKSDGILIAVTDEEFLQYGSRVAYLSVAGDTIIPFGQYTYLGTDTLRHYANVAEFSDDRSAGRWVAIDRNQKTLYDIVSLDNGPDSFREGFVRARRNGKMGFANEYGQIVIPCVYDFARGFENGKAKVTFKAKAVKDKSDEHTTIQSDEWFYIDKKGKEIR